MRLGAVPRVRGAQECVTECLKICDYRKFTKNSIIKYPSEINVNLILFSAKGYIL